ncbi:uncharacterized protein L3040_006535 [Drepanopeziza brunnea f. sp. 'multigermtubi']|uniref:Uncharacterized protein n=1 Tax=Marssonina brunnea f. sp. multigermtubi (strain MB_m1) TaxID=1072389 RepID=K1WMX1_MARBU|nr:uncharacterized protein MBM_02282 [Drepanopeziza brunnea f. sp. 'multigermtubi' MB_m1]EKD19045.1 hypothetical protein MBM_02282 [Drepanopeziza brunnea f. sp. 'multigermtubi' MB_m1]KAJ5038856.1 hypothetical protein L3040_006535 [Drepanopeziza brunnea f. sp. 'multigermtubi']
MVSVKSLIMALFISAVSAQGQSCTCGDSSTTQALCGTISTASFNSVAGRCNLPTINAANTFRQNCKATATCLAA